MSADDEDLASEFAGELVEAVDFPYTVFCDNERCRNYRRPRTLMMSEIDVMEWKCDCDAELEIVDDRAPVCKNKACEYHLKLTFGDKCHLCEWATKSVEEFDYEEELDEDDLTTLERKLLEAVKRYVEPDSSGHGKGKKVSSGNSLNRHQGGQKRKVDHRIAKAAKVVDSYEQLVASEGGSRLPRRKVYDKINRAKRTIESICESAKKEV